MSEEIGSKWNVIISSLQDICQMDSLSPSKAESLQELQKHKENIDKASRLIAPLLENVNFLLLKNNTSGISSSNPVVTSVSGSESSGNKGNSIPDEDLSSSIGKSATSSTVSNSQIPKVAAVDEVNTTASSMLNNERTDFSNSNSPSGSFYDVDSSTNKSPKHGLQDTPSRHSRNRRSVGHHTGGSSIVKTTPEPKRGKSFFSSQYNPSDPILVGSEVAFKLRYGEWIQCVVTKIIDSTKFEVTDPEPDENNNPGKTYKTNWKEVSLVPPVKFGKLQHYPVGTKVIARYPETTTFYSAEVIGTKRDGKCRLRFDGEEEVGKETEVERRLVLPYPTR